MEERRRQQLFLETPGSGVERAVGEDPLEGPGLLADGVLGAQDDFGKSLASV